MAVAGVERRARGFGPRGEAGAPLWAEVDMWESFGSWLGLSRSDMMGGPLLSHTPDDSESERAEVLMEKHQSSCLKSFSDSEWWWTLVFVWFIPLMKVPQDHFLVKYMPRSLFTSKWVRNILHKNMMPALEQFTFLLYAAFFFIMKNSKENLGKK